MGLALAPIQAMPSERIKLARHVAERACDAPQDRSPPPPGSLARTLAIGDPQTRFDRFASILDVAGLLGPAGWLRPDVGLVCMGDYFDFLAAHTHSRAEIEAAGRDGLLILEWLAAHPSSQVTLLLGNHDVTRVMELGCIDDESFAESQRLALAAFASMPVEREALEQQFAERFDSIPTPEVARRDFATFSTAQRQAMQRLLLSRRLCLAAVGSHAGHPVLLTHAGISTRELDVLGLAHDSDAQSVATALNQWLHIRVDRVEPLWSDGIAAPLDLEPLHVSGVSGHEAGGLLSHRPANPERPGAGRTPDVGWEFRPERPRRFHPHDLPPGLVQACGHTRASSSTRELVPWATDRAVGAEPGDLRSLRVRDRRILYDLDLLPAEPGDAMLYLLDADLDRAPVDRVGMLELEAVIS